MTCSQLPSSRQHSLFSVSPVTQINYIFLSCRGEGGRLRAQRVSMESLVFCWLQLGFEPAPNFLQPGSGLRKHSRGSLWHREAELCPTASALAFIAQYFLIFFIFFCSLAGFTAIFPVPGRHNVIFHTSWRGTGGRRRTGGWEPGSVTCGWRWHLPPSPASPSCPVSQSPVSLAGFALRSSGEAESWHVLHQFLIR